MKEKLSFGQCPIAAFFLNEKLTIGWQFLYVEIRFADYGWEKLFLVEIL